MTVEMGQFGAETIYPFQDINARFCEGTGSMQRFMWIFATVILILPVVLRAEASRATVNYPPSVEQIVELAHDAFADHRYQRAAQLYTEAYYYGMAIDSLYYFLARIAMYKAEYDSAIIFNYSMSPKPKSSLKTLQLKQRYAIYSIVGNASEMAKTADSLKRNAADSFARTLIPQLNTSGLFGFRYNRDREAFPSIPGELLSPEFSETGPNLYYEAGAKLTWKFPSIGKSRIKAGGLGILRKHYRFNPSFSAPNFADTLLGGLEKNLQLFTSWDRFVPHLSLGYTGRFTENYLKNSYVSHAARLSFSSAGKQWYSAADLEYQQGTSGALYRNIALSWYSDQSFFSGKGFSLAALGFIYDGEPIEYPTSLNLGPLFTGATDYYLVQTNNLINVSTDSAKYFIWSLPDTLAFHPANSRYLMLNQPLRYISAQPEIGYRLKTTRWLTFGATAGWRTDFYLSNTSWYSLSLPRQSIEQLADSAGSVYVAYHRPSGAYYWRELSGSATIPVFVFSERRRIDHEPSVALYADFSIPVLGWLRIGGRLNRTISNLSEVLPMPTPDTQWTIITALTKSFSR
jgi:hypothetical protein